MGFALIYVSTLGKCCTNKCIKISYDIVLIFVPFEKIVALILRTPYIILKKLSLKKPFVLDMAH